MNIEQLQLVNRNETTDILLKLFSTMEQKSDETNLASFFNHLVSKGNKIIKNQYDSFFKELEEFDIGFIAPNGVFKWNFSFRDISEQILFPNKMVNIRSLNSQTHYEPVEKKEITVSPKKKGRGRPKGSRNKSNQEQSPSRPLERAKDEVVPVMLTNTIGKEVVFMFTNSKGRTLPFNLEDAERLLRQVEDIKQHLG